MITDETVSRVVQALEIKDSFNYVLNSKNITELLHLGYYVKVNATIDFGLADCTITTLANYVSLGDVCRQQLGQQAQYCSRYADPDWKADYIYCGQGLRIILNKNKDYHQYKIHKDDVSLFVARVKTARGM